MASQRGGVWLHKTKTDRGEFVPRDIMRRMEGFARGVKNGDMASALGNLAIAAELGKVNDQWLNWVLARANESVEVLHSRADAITEKVRALCKGREKLLNSYSQFKAEAGETPTRPEGTTPELKLAGKTNG